MSRPRDEAATLDAQTKGGRATVKIAEEARRANDLREFEILDSVIELKGTGWLNPERTKVMKKRRDELAEALWPLPPDPETTDGSN